MHCREDSMKIAVLACAVLVSAQLSLALPQLYYTGGTYFRSPAQSSVSAEAVTVALASLLSVAPPLTVSPDIAEQVDQLLQPDLFNKPDAVLCVTVAGSNSGLDGAKPAAQVVGGSQGSQASQLAASIAYPGLAPDSHVDTFPLDYSVLQGCGQACLEESLKTALAAIGATYAPGAGALNGSVTYKGVGISLDSTAGQLWATEMASLYQTAADAAQEHNRRVKQGDSRAAKIALLEASLVSPQAFESAFGSDSAEAKAASQATLHMLQVVQELLSDSFDGRLAVQTALLGRISEPFDNAKGLVKWQEAHRRKLQQYRPSNSLTNAQWSQRATAVVAFLVLLFGALAGVQCLTNMHFKRDTLLFGSAKQD